MYPIRRLTIHVQNATHWNPEDTILPRSYSSNLKIISVCVTLTIVAVLVTGGGFFVGKGPPLRVFFDCGIYSPMTGEGETDFVFAPKYMKRLDNPSIDLSNLKHIGDVYSRGTKTDPFTGYLNLIIDGEKITDVETLQVWRKRMLDYSTKIQAGDDAILNEFKSGLMYAASEPALPIKEND